MSDERNEVEEMLGLLGQETNEVEVDDEPEVEETVSDDEEVANDDDTDEDQPDESQADEEDGEAEDEEVDTPDEITTLRGQVSELTNFISGFQKQIEAMNKPPQAAAEEIPLADDALPSVEKLVEETDFDELFENKAAFTKFLTQVINTTREDTRKALTKEIPTITNKQVETLTQQQKLQAVVQSFYDTNEDLAQVKSTVSLVTKNVGLEHPDWQLPQILEEAAARTRKMLGFHTKPKAKPSVTRRETPTKVSKTGSRKNAKPAKKTKQQQQIDDLLKAVR